MDSSNASNKYPLVPPTEQKCVWMTAGILSYQLCDRQFDCDHCPLDSALRTFPLRAPTTGDTSPATSPSPAQRKNLLPGFLYGRKHCWVKSGEASDVRVGVEPLLASLMQGAKTVVLPSVGDQVQAGKTCAWIVLEGGTLPIVSPLDGEVTRTNAILVDQAHDIRDDPFGRGWLFEVSTSVDLFNLSFLYRMGEADRYYSEDEKKFQTLVGAEEKKHRSTTGATLADGGQPVQDVASMLGPDKFFVLLMKVFA
ncbi:MAG TPA: glycine cleavage system protein H [Bacteroidota bacterium]|nr:glycine cleavage system protein H [Bacteroidota bacterium]